MKLVVKVDYNTVLVFPAEQASILVPAISTAIIHEDKCYSAKVYKPKSDVEPLEFKFVEDSMFGEQPDAFVAVQTQRDESEKKYLAEWTKGREMQKKIDELQAKIDAMKSAVASTEGDS